MTSIAPIQAAELPVPHTGRVVRACWLISTLALRAGGRVDLASLRGPLPDELALEVSVLEPNHVHDGLVDVRLCVPGGAAAGRALRLASDSPRVRWAEHHLAGHGQPMIDLLVEDAGGAILEATFDPARLADPRRCVRWARSAWLARLGVPGGRAELDRLDLILPPSRGE